MSAEGGLHIPKMQGEVIHGFNLFGAEVSNTILSTWIFMVFLFIAVGVFYFSIKTNRLPKIKNTGILFIQTLNNGVNGIVGDKDYARRFFFLTAGFFTFILFGNIFSLILDWINIISKPGTTVEYLRPINSDLNTTAAMAVVAILLSQIAMMYYKGLFGYLKGYLFNFSGHNIAEKVVNVFLGWLHFIGEFSKLLSLSLRLFGNILAGVILISVMSFLTGNLQILGIRVGEVAVSVFWMFELFVAFIQALIFFFLVNIYFKEAKNVEGH